MTAQYRSGPLWQVSLSFDVQVQDKLVGRCEWKWSNFRLKVIKFFCKQIL